MYKVNWIIVLFISLQVSFGQSLEDEYKEISTLAASNPKLAYQKAKVFQQDALDSQNEILIGQSFYLLGLTQYFLSKFYLAKDFFQKAIEAIPEGKGRDIKEACYNNIGICEEYLGNLDEALSAYISSRTIAKQMGNEKSAFQTDINIGLLEIKIGRISEGEMILEKTKSYFEENKDTLNTALCIHNLAKAANERGALTTFINMSEQALSLYESVGYSPGMIEILSNLGNAYTQKKEFKDAQKVLDEAYQLASKQTYDGMSGIILKNKGLLYEAQDDYSKAEVFYKKAISTLQTVENIEQLESLRWILLRLYNKTGNSNSFEEQYELLRNENKNFLKEASLSRVDELRQVYEYDQQQITIRNQKSKFYFTLTIALLLLILLLLAIFAYLENRKKLKLLYKANKKLLLETNLKPIQNRNSRAEKYESLFKEVKTFLESPENYLNPNLDLTEIAQKLHTNETYISEAVNIVGKKNLNQLLNGIRIKAVQRAIHEGSTNKIVSDICYKFGFNSTSTFYRVFKSELGMTPQQYISIKLKEKKNV